MPVRNSGYVLDLGVQAEIIDKFSAWFSYNGVRMGQGRDQAKNFLKDQSALITMYYPMMGLHNVF